MFALRTVRKLFAPGQGIDGVTLDFPAGRTTALLGSSGCGKSTLLRLLAGLLTPDAGEVLYDGKPVADWPARRLSLGYVIQGGGLFPHLTARQNATLVADYLGRPAAQTAARVADLANLVRLDATLLDRLPRQLSGGQQQRAALLRALVLEPATLLLDEPLGALDPIVRADLQADLKRVIAESKTTVVLVTHDLAEAAFLADRLVLLDAGKVIQEGSYAELARRPATPFVRRFFEAQRPAPTVEDAA